MTGVSTEGAYAQPLDEIHRAVIERFPLLEVIEFSDQPIFPPVRLPHFIGLLATILEATEKPCCVVLPDSKDVAIAVSTLIAITRLQNEFAEVLRTHASSSFRQGRDNVLVHPSGLVYRYDGFFTDTLFRLGVIGRKDGRSLDVKEIARLEKTTRKRPKGYLDSNLSQSQSTILGSLLGINITLNRNLLRNHMLVLGARKSFIEDLGRWTIQIKRDEQTIRQALRNEIPFGTVAEGGRLCFFDGFIASGEPLVALASKTEDLAAHCSNAERFKKTVLVNDIDYLMKDLQAYDAITENQHTLILASESERESVRILKDRGSEVWRLAPEEILLGIETGTIRAPLHTLVGKAFCIRDLVISESTCSEEHLDRAATELSEAAHAMSSSDNGTIRELLRSMFRITMFCAEYLGQDSERFACAADRLLALANGHVQNAKVWLSPEINNRIKVALDSMQLAVINLSQSGITPKGMLLLESLKKADLEHNRIAVAVARQGTDCQELQQWLKTSGLVAEIYPVGELPEDQHFDQVLVVSWPRTQRFDRLLHQYLTDDLRLLAYGFEEVWLNQYRKRYKRSFLSGISRTRKLQLVGLDSTDTMDNQAQVGPQEGQDGLVTFDLREEQYLVRRKMTSAGEAGNEEELIDAFYADFSGSTFAYLTEGHELPILNKYISGEQAGSGKIPLRTAQHLNVGDYVMFRESGDSDIIRFLAEDHIGRDDYQQLRLTAGRWRTALQKLGEDPKTVWDQLRKAGFTRHLQTVRAWLVDESMICPQDMGDVRKIAEASGDAQLLALLPEVERAKDRLMSLHISAGSRLTELLLKDLPSKLSLIGQVETEVDLGVGKVWIVHIEELDRSPLPQRRSQVNRLLWDASGT